MEKDVTITRDWIKQIIQDFISVSPLNTMQGESDEPAWDDALVGFASGTIQNLPANRLFLKRASAKGVYWNHDLDPEMMQRCNDRMHQMLVSGNFTPQVAVYTGLNELPKALDDLKARRSVGKLVLDLSGRKDAL